MQDQFGRTVRYLRISVTDRCNLRCAYCRPSQVITPAFHEKVLSYEELLRLCGLFWAMGFDTFRLTGGEPLVRRDLVPFVARVRAALPGASLALTSNGLLFGEHAAALKAAGLDRVNLSLDSLDPATFLRLTGHDGLDRVLAGIDAALAAGFRRVKLNVVVIRGVNQDEPVRFVERFAGRPLYIRFIEFMPYGPNGWEPEKVYPYQAILDDLRARYDLTARPREDAGPSRDFDVAGAACRVGIISPLTRSFCTDCNRMRLTSDGHLRPCLFSEGEVDLRALLRGGADDDALRAAVCRAVEAKPLDHGLATDACGPLAFRRAMTEIGG